VDQVERPVEILCCRNSNQVERIPLSASYENPQVLPLSMVGCCCPRASLGDIACS